MGADLSAVEQRAQDGLLLAHCGIEGLRQRLPLRWPTPPGTPPSPKKAYRSLYLYRGWHDLHDPAFWKQCSDFDLTLRLIDFSGLRPVLAQRLGWRSGRGWTPFDPLSFFLLTGWQITNAWSRAETLHQPARSPLCRLCSALRLPRGLLSHRRRPALRPHHPRPSLRYGPRPSSGRGSTGRCGRAGLNQLIAQSLTLIRDRLISQDAWQQALVCPDGMIHDAASACAAAPSVTPATSPPPPAQPRPCPAKDKERPGRACDTLACAQTCQHGTPRDPQARLVVYSGSNQRADPNQGKDTEISRQGRGFLWLSQPAPAVVRSPAALQLDPAGSLPPGQRPREKTPPQPCCCNCPPSTPTCSSVTSPPMRALVTMSSSRPPTMLYYPTSGRPPRSPHRS